MGLARFSTSKLVTASYMHRSLWVLKAVAGGVSVGCVLATRVLKTAYLHESKWFIGFLMRLLEGPLNAAGLRNTLQAAATG